MELKTNIKRIKNEVSTNNDGEAIHEDKVVNIYWQGEEDTKAMTPAKQLAVRILQTCFRYWIKLKLMRKKSQFTGFSMKSKATTVCDVM